jgi:hypothetical protein
MSATFLEDMRVVRELMNDFLSKSHIQKGLKQISEVGITGWEKWWQVELAIFLDEHPGIKEWDMEHEFEVDRRTSGGDRLYVDVGFTMNGWSNEYVFLELKQNSDYKKCIDQMFKDAEKFECLKKKSIDGVAKRSVFVVGLFKKYDMEYIFEYFESTMEHYGFDFEDNEYMFLESKDIDWILLIF